MTITLTTTVSRIRSFCSNNWTHWSWSQRDGQAEFIWQLHCDKARCRWFSSEKMLSILSALLLLWLLLLLLWLCVASHTVNRQCVINHRYQDGRVMQTRLWICLSVSETSQQVIDGFQWNALIDSCQNERCLAINKLLYFSADMKHKPDPGVVLTEFIPLSVFCSNSIINDNDRNALRRKRGEGERELH